MYVSHMQYASYGHRNDTMRDVIIFKMAFQKWQPKVAFAFACTE